jgi:hypothetical protein
MGQISQKSFGGFHMTRMTHMTPMTYLYLKMILPLERS